MRPRISDTSLDSATSSIAVLADEGGLGFPQHMALILSALEELKERREFDDKLREAANTLVELLQVRG